MDRQDLRVGILSTSFGFFPPCRHSRYFKMEGIPQEFHVVCEPPLIDFMCRGSKHPIMMVMRCVSFFIWWSKCVYLISNTNKSSHKLFYWDTGFDLLSCCSVVCVRGAFCNQAACGFLIIGFIRRQTTARNRDFTHGKGSNDHICPVRGIRYPYLMCLVLCFHLLFRANLLLQFQLQRLKLLVTPCLQD